MQRCISVFRCNCTPGGHVDLFGVSDQSRSSKEDKMKVKMIDNILRQPTVNYFGCFRKESNDHNEHSYYTYPPVPCTYYGKQVCVQEIMSNISNTIMERMLCIMGSHMMASTRSHWTPGAGDGI